MLKKSICVLLSLISLTTPTAYAVNAGMNPHSTEEPSTFQLTTSNGDIFEYDVEYTDDSVITTHTDGAITTTVEVIYETGETITKTYSNSRLQSQESEINESVKNSNQSAKIVPRLVFPVKYQDIGSINYKKMILVYHILFLFNVKKYPKHIPNNMT